jgi:hypothetical protein
MKLSRREFNNVKKSWLTYVQSEREKQGKESYVRLGRCCGKSESSYPHWPPTCQAEALDQLQCLLGRSYPSVGYHIYSDNCCQPKEGGQVRELQETSTGRYRWDDIAGAEELPRTAPIRSTNCR